MLAHFAKSLPSPRGNDIGSLSGGNSLSGTLAGLLMKATGLRVPWATHQEQGAQGARPGKMISQQWSHLLE